VLENVGTPGYDPLSFATVLEVKGKNDHAALLAMLDDVADPAQGAQQLLARHFDQANYLSWLAANLLVGNQDTASQNMFLAAGPDGQTWRLLPWDYDQALDWVQQPGGAVQPADVPARYDDGIGLYWQSPLHRRVFQDPTLLAALTARVDQLAAGALAPAQVTATAAAASQVVRPWLQRDPDRAGLPGPLEAYDAELARLPGVISRRQALYHEVLARPMPFELQDPQGQAFRWEAAVQLQGEPVRYDFTLAATPDLAHPLVALHDLSAPQATVQVAAGVYYWQVVARTPGGAWQYAHARYVDSASGQRYEGVARIDLTKQ